MTKPIGQPYSFGFKPSFIERFLAGEDGLRSGSGGLPVIAVAADEVRRGYHRQDENALPRSVKVAPSGWPAAAARGALPAGAAAVGERSVTGRSGLPGKLPGAASR